MRLTRPRFSLLTLLLAVAWSAVVVWVNVRPRVDVKWAEALSHTVIFRTTTVYFTRWGWPFPYANHFSFWPERMSGPPPGEVEAYWALAGDVAIGLLLVVVLTWGSNQLLRRVGARLRRKTQETQL